MAIINYSEIFENYKQELLSTFEIEKDRLIASTFADLRHIESWMVRDSVYEVSDWTDVLYKEMISCFSSISTRKAYELITSLFSINGIECERKKIFLKESRRVTLPLLIKKDDVNIFIRINSSVEFIDDPLGREIAFGVLEETNCDKYIIVLLQWANSRTVQLREKLLSRRYKNSPNGFEILFFEEFILHYFGRGALQEFRKSVRSFKAELQDRIGYRITELCSERTMNSFKDETEQMLRTFSYHTLMPQEIDNDQIEKLDNNYLRANRVKLLVGTGDFAKSFITSEWLYKKYGFSNKLDNTYIVAGYLKSIEQVLYDIILIEGVGRQIKAKGSYSRTVTVSEHNTATIDSTLGSLLRFFNMYRDMFEVNSSVAGRINEIIKDWKNEERNGLFHKEVLAEARRVEEIRRKTVFLYYLILGGLDLEEDTLGQLGMPE